MKLLQTRKLELKIIHQNCLNWPMPANFFFFFFHIGEENYKNVNSQIKNLVSKNKREFYETNLRQKVNKPNFEKS